jgi:seryl-tRNA synthetase
MIDIKWIRKHPEHLDLSLTNRGMATQSREILDLDAKYLEALQKTEELQAERNGLARAIGAAKQKGENAADLQERGSHLRTNLENLAHTMESLKRDLKTLLEALPNIPEADVPVGSDETGNQEVHRWGTPPSFPFEIKAHELLGGALGLDFEAATRMSGSRFVVLRGGLARLERALAAFMLDVHTQTFGYEELSVPYLVREEAAYGVGQLPKFRDDLFATTDGRILISTAEVPLTNLVREQILPAASLPLRFVAYTPCFRSEAGSAGKDTHGMIRLHQFSKVELMHVTTEDQGEEEFAHLRRAAETILERLGLPYRTMLLCTGDMGAASRKTYDLEVWLPGQNAYREISSCSIFGDYQARRMNARVRDAQGHLHFAHTLNGSALAVGRTLVALMENYQQKDGSLLIPKELQPYMGGQSHLEPCVGI